MFVHALTGQRLAKSLEKKLALNLSHLSQTGTHHAVG